MSQKGGISMPAAIAVGLIIVAIVILFLYIYVWNTNIKLQAAFVDTTKVAEEHGCSISGPLAGLLCPSSG